MWPRSLCCQCGIKASSSQLVSQIVSVWFGRWGDCSGDGFEVVRFQMQVAWTGCLNCVDACDASVFRRVPGVDEQEACGASGLGLAERESCCGFEVVVDGPGAGGGVAVLCGVRVELH